MSDCLITNVSVVGRKRSKAKFKSFSNCDNGITQTLNAIFKINTDKIKKLSRPKVKISGQGKISTIPQLDMNLTSSDSLDNGFINAFTTISGNLLVNVNGEFVLKNSYADKFAGELQQLSSLNSFSAVQKLYPIKDEVNNNFVNKNIGSQNLFNQIDEGIFIGNYNENFNTGFRVSDDNISYIQPFSTSTNGSFKYKCEVTAPYHHPKHSFLFLRIAAPFVGKEVDKPPQYRLYNLILEDPSGNTIVKYKDLLIEGDANYTSNTNRINYSTYISEPEINNANLHTWDNDYPILGEASGYKLNIDCDIICNAEAFTDGFNTGYEENVCDTPALANSSNNYLAIDGSPLSTQSLILNPSNALRISAIEICNSGDLCDICSVTGVKKDGYSNLYVQFAEIGQRVSKVIRPVKLFSTNYNPEIYPSSNSVWISSPDYDNNVYANTSEKHSQILLNQLNNKAELQYITLVNSNPYSDSGRLTLKFSHEPPRSDADLRGGAFTKSFLKQIFEDAEYESVLPVDNYFVVDSLELRVRAKKAPNTNNFVLDVVGYSDDKLLNITPKIGAFLQNKILPSYIGDEYNVVASELGDLLVDTNQVGTVPLISGFKAKNELGISSNSLSDESLYYKRGLTSVDAGDHYILSTLPVIDSTEFKDYIIPLEIYEDYVSLGKSIDYSMSSYFENLYIDLFPIPSGASIENIELVVYFKPSNGMNLHTFGTPTIKELGRKDIRLLPQNLYNDLPINGDIDNGSLSVIENIPQAYKNYDSLKTNYARRWRGVDGNIVSGPYDPNQFDFSFYNPTLNHPFLNGFYDLTNVSGDWIFSEDYAHSGRYTGSNPILKNIGWRFNDTSLFNHPTNYTTIDWTKPASVFYSKISDAFDSALLLNNSDYIEFDNDELDIDNSFNIYLRFSVSNINFTAYEKATLIKKVRNNFFPALELSLQNEAISLTCWDTITNSIQSTSEPAGSLSDYQFPLSILMTYTGPSGYLNIYARNEINDADDLILSLSPISLQDNGYPLLIGGSSSASGLFIHEIGISNSGNIVESEPNRQLKQTTVDNFLNSHSHSFNESTWNRFKLHEYIDEDTSAWYLGAFKVCSFSVAFDGFKTRIGKDYLIHHLKHHGSGYESVTNLPLPSSINVSGLAYHTQIENDFLRFNLTDIPDANPHFYSVPPRISKNIPRGYKFDERAIVVDTILEHETEKYIYWKDGKVGPKLIVSLYSKNQDPVDRPSKINWGLVNRSIHYLEPSGCYTKISSTFNHDDLLDTSEPWALFDVENSYTEFKEKYYSKDIDDMFLQYDLVYPCSEFSIGTADGKSLISSTGGIFHSHQCGSAFESDIKIHSVNVRLEDALTYWENYNDNMGLYSSGQAIRFENVDMFVHGHERIFESGFQLFTSGSPWPQESGQLNIILASGISGIQSNPINLFVKQRGSFNVPQNFGSSFSYDSDGPIFGSSDQLIYLPILMSGGQPRSDQTMSLVMSDNTLDQTFSSSISLHTRAKSFNPVSYSDICGLYMPDAYALSDVYRSGVMSLYVPNNQVFIYNAQDQFNLYINTDANIVNMSGVCTLFTTNYGSAGTRGFFSWNKDNLGLAIDPIIDSGVPELSADDEIRGVDLICYGDCDDSDRKCEEIPIVLHDLTWYGDSICVDGGIFRAKGVYTNLNTSAFNTEVGYSGHFYGIRKYADLLPNSPYIITIKTKTGTDTQIYLPSEYTELDYGSNNYVGYSGVKLAADKDMIPEERQAGNKFGKSIAVKKDVIAVGAPMQTLQYVEDDTTYTLEEAGSIFIYRRDPRPYDTYFIATEEGLNLQIGDSLLSTESDKYSWPVEEHKSKWELETKLTLPSGLFKDYYTTTTSNYVDGREIEYPITQTIWEVGGEGRQLGYSLDLAINENIKSFGENRREILVAGGPSASWSREFEELQPSGVNIALLILTDEFQPTILVPPRTTLSYHNILSAITNKDLVFTYFSDPPVNFNVKIIICEPRSDANNLPLLSFPEPKPDFISNFRIPKNSGFVNDPNNPSRQRVFDAIKSAFHSVFPYDETKIHNNIPVMMGVFLDDTMSLGEIAVEPGLTDFLNYYRSYSYASGLKDFYGASASGAIYKTVEASENWISASISILNDLLDTGRLRSDNEVRFFSSGVGPEFFNTNLSQFNVPPYSGGRAYIFEKESGNWNLIQEIKSPVLSKEIDRYGHAVAISQDTNIIGIGSPYIDECCQVWQYRPEAKRAVFDYARAWIDAKDSRTGGTVPRYQQLREQWDEWVQVYGQEYAKEILYSNMTPTEKFEIRQFFNINEYEKIFTYNYSSIPYKGAAWSWLAEEFAPISRLGYSVAINEDGNSVAFGAPTDSFNVFDDKNLYFTGDNNTYLRRNLDYDASSYDLSIGLSNSVSPSWQNNVNAGAIRLFEARDYYPHNKVVEYGKFGNLQQSLNDPLDSGHFNYLSGIFSDRNFRKMPEDEVIIPQDAGLAFIITPGVDAVSDEIVDNIISWLALGDRNLVLVGNDPEWESNGIYKNSNAIINKLLGRLNSRMRLYAARNKAEALLSPSSVVLPSFQPALGVGSYVEPGPIKTAYGVGDIRMHYPNFSEKMICYPDDPKALVNLRAVNEKCELPLIHQGDLRAQFNGYCIWYPKGEPVLVTYPVNWALRLGTSSPPGVCLSQDEDPPKKPLPGGDPVPLLAAALTKQATFVRPATPPQFATYPITRTVNTPTEPVGLFVTESLANTPAFVWNSGTQDYLDYKVNVFSMPNRTSSWFKPPLFEERQGILQAKANTTSEILMTKQKVADISMFCAEELMTTNNSKIIAIANTETESAQALYTAEGDINIAFYRNMVAKNVRGESRIAQLGGWTGRTSFADADSESILYTIFSESNNAIQENVDIDELISQALNVYDVLWIANPVRVPNPEQVGKLSSWLATGNKKLIVTHNNTITQMLIANEVLSALGSTIKTVFLPVKSEYPSIKYGSQSYYSDTTLYLNSNHPISLGFGKYRIENFSFTGSFFAFEPNERITPVMYVNEPIYDDKVVNNTYFRMNPGVDKVSFPAVAGSGYRIFIDYISENVSENNQIIVSVANVSTQPKAPYPTSIFGINVSLQETLNDNPLYEFSQLPAEINYSTVLQQTAPNQIATKHFDLQVQEGQSTIDMYFSSIDGRITDPPFIPKTIRILSISGVAMPVENRTGMNSYEEIIGYETVKVSDGSPSEEYTITFFDVIKSINDPYCNCGEEDLSIIKPVSSECSDNSDCIKYGYNNQLIADGPVVVAQELEMITDFPAGVSRSRITVLADSNLVQGRYMVDEFKTMSLETTRFIRSLYPNVSFPNVNAFGKQYTEFTKIVAPERGSPQKYKALGNNNGSTVNFGSTGFSKTISSFNNKDSLYHYSYVERPKKEAWPEGSKPEKIEEIKSGVRTAFFATEVNAYGGFTRFSGVIDGKLYIDSSISNGMPSIMKEKRYDYLDFDNFPSGYPGDLFGYSIAIEKDRLIVGSPFAAFSDETVHDWNHYISTFGQSGIKLSYNGGAGAVYIYEKTFNGVGPRGVTQPWEFVQKLRPQSINVGQDVTSSGLSQSYSILGPNQYTEQYLTNRSIVTDQFGYDVDINSDIIVVGAPGHDFDKYAANGSGEFIRKEFNASFTIPDRIIVELGNSGVRSQIGSGTSVLNNGAVFTFENSISDWTQRKQKWKFIEKLLPQGPNSRNQSLNVDDAFGRSVSIDRSNRTDSDYVIAVGSENHDYSSSGTNMLVHAGAAYTNDIMLRQPPPVLPDPNTYIDYKVFGSKSYEDYVLRGITNNSQPDKEYTNSGIVYADILGNIFLEVSGQDPIAKGFIQHRPYIVSIEGVYKNGIEFSGNLPLYVGGRHGDIVQNMNLFVPSTTGNVYNTLGMYTSSIVGFGSGILNLNINKDPITISDSGVFLYTSGIGNNSDTLNMRIRGY